MRFRLYEMASKNEHVNDASIAHNRKDNERRIFLKDVRLNGGADVKKTARRRQHACTTTWLCVVGLIRKSTYIRGNLFDKSGASKDRIIEIWLPCVTLTRKLLGIDLWLTAT